ncbi:MAG: penicillin-binding protein 2 [Bacteroidales bacterium]|nr:penicillin-binding protein 2 [Bacteroidales bacterium]MBN2758108.1 penicillin-binding protein 2 [Bacteroidales bacterium]
METTNSNRQYFIAGFIILILLIYIAKLASLQIMENTYKRSADNNVFRHIIQYPSRGLIFDRNGDLLVYNQPVYDVIVVPNELEVFDTTEFCNIVNISKDELNKKLEEAKSYSRFKQTIIIQLLPFDKYGLLAEKLYKFRGFYTQTRTIRSYTKPIAASLLGYVGEVDDKMIKKNAYYKSGDYIGISGIEKSYENNLRGRKGINIFLVDVHNRLKGSYKDGKFDTLAVVGSNIVTSIDSKLQAYCELLLKNKKGSIVAIEPSTGEILALATSPTYDPNLLVGRERTDNYRKLLLDNEKPLFNRAIRAMYPPGSTFKPVNALIGLQEEVITAKTVLPCNGGYRVGSFHQHCHHGSAVTFTYSIQGSCNAYYSQVFMKILKNSKYESIGLAYKSWRDYLQKFGIGRKLNTDLINEVSGLVYSKEHYDKYFEVERRWKPLRLVSMAIGQGELGITPLQMANVTSAIANRGYYYIPHIVKNINRNDSIDNRFYQKQYVGIDSVYFEPVIEGMELVVKAGTARSAFLDNISICGKTGTAENPHGKDHSIFIAFAPRDNPKIAIAIFVENAGFGSTWAAPMSSLIIEKYINDSISRQYLEDRIINTNLMNPTK